MNLQTISDRNLADRIKRLDYLTDTATNTTEYCKLLAQYQQARDAAERRAHVARMLARRSLAAERSSK